jgi:hypothetical protein
MQRSNSTFVTIEQVGVWIEHHKWFDQNEATRIGFGKATLAQIIDKHLCGAIRFSAIVDGNRCTLDPISVGDFIFEIVWLQRAGLFHAGSRGNCEVRGRSIQVYLPDKISDLSCRSNELVCSPGQQVRVNGYHRVVRQIRVSREEAIAAWPAGPKSNAATHAVLARRNDLMDALLVAASDPSFPKSAVALFDVLRQSASSLSSLSDAELEQFISGECPRFWGWTRSYWSDPTERKKQLAHTGNPKAANYTFEEHGRLFYKWSLIEDSLLVSIAELGPLQSHGALLARVQKIVATKDSGPGRTENDRHFTRYRRFFRATAGGGIRAGATAGKQGVRR